MQSVKLQTFEKPYRPFTNLHRPTIQSNEVLVEVVAEGVDPIHMIQENGEDLLTEDIEIVGIIVEVGADVSNWKIGDHVCALLAGGGYAEYCAVPAVQCLPVPKDLSLVEAAAVPETFFTVWANIFMRGRLQRGETLLIHGGNCGISKTGIQLAHAWGAKVFVTVGNEEKGEACVRLGADGYVNYKNQDFVQRVRELNGGRGVDVILDTVRGDNFAKNLELLETEGRLVQIAFQEGNDLNVSCRSLIMKRRRDFDKAANFLLTPLADSPISFFVVVALYLFLFYEL
eukprot:CAMPEP_0173137012 /NCGR_PEP_ID=MMETSP1105-20130129/2831_1 /TAXON_ID=2985 /ORGANISM="Ochromonas sp., Strain BG-1" /LENGTH=285 /DNA_ID=CAMNT_0014049315 /DNA_START=28 /DNA_END=885 /DNA_ORIENTATION=-